MEKKQFGKFEIAVKNIMICLKIFEKVYKEE